MAHYPIRKASAEARMKYPMDTLAADPWPPTPIHELSPRVRYPFDALHVGECFLVPADAISQHSIRARASGAHYGRRYRVITHVDKRVYEVVRIA